MLFCMMLIAYAEDNNGDDDAHGDNTKTLVFSRRSRQKLRN